MSSRPGVAPIDDATVWDAFAAAHPAGNFLQSSRWGDLKARYGWTAQRLAIDEGGRIVAGAQLLLRVRRLTPLGPRLGVAYVPRGPLVTGAGQVEPLMQAVTLNARAAGASFVRIEPVEDSTGAALPALGYRASSAYIQIPRTAIVDLHDDLDRVIGGFKPKMRYNIRLANRRGVAIRAARSDADLEAFYHLTQVTAARERFAVHSAAYYRDVWQSFRPDHAALLLAYLGDEPLAAVLAVRWSRTAIYLYGASSNRHRNLMAPHALQWAAMQWAQAYGCSQYDLWGMADPGLSNDPLAGVHRFKLGFNPRIVTYPGAYDRSLDPVRAWVLRGAGLRARDALARLRRRPARATAG